MMDLSAPWRYSSPLAAPSAIFIRVDHGILRQTPNVQNEEDKIIIPQKKIKCAL
jgi:hypothetical protein